MDDAGVQRFKTVLLERLDELGRLRSGSRDARAPVTLDQQSVGRVSRIDALQQQAMAKAQERQRAMEFVRIEQALRRIEEGEFGFCLDCGEEIAPKRLEIDPAASHCVNCAGH